MSLKQCPECKTEVSSSAAACPKCGHALKMSMAKKGGIGCGLFLLLALAASTMGGKAAHDSGSGAGASTATGAAKGAAPVALVDAYPNASIDRAELARIFKLGGTATDLQRDAKEKEIEGKIIDWTGVKVYEVKKSGNCYSIQTEGDDSTPGMFVKACPPEGITDAAALSLTTGSIVRVKGKIDDITMRNLDIKPAIVTP